MHLLWINDNDKAQRAEWDKAHAAARAPLQQHWAYGSALQGFGARCLRCMVMQDNQALALAQFLVRRYAGLLEIALCTRGPVWLDSVHSTSAAPTDQQRALRRAAHRLIRRELPLRGLRLVMFSPDLADANEAGVDRLQRVMTGYATVLLDLQDDPAQLRQRLPRNWHNRLNAAEASALKVERVGNKPSQYQWLLDREQALQQTRGYRALPKTFIPAYQAAYQATYQATHQATHQATGRDSPGSANPNKPEALFTLRADLDRTAVAGMMFLRHGDAATYHVGWSDATQRLPGAHNLLLWQAMLQLRQAGVRRIDLGGVNTGRSAGVARFKIGTGGDVVVLAGTYLAL
jgi:hypothetical protein